MFEIVYTENAEKIMNKLTFDVGKRIYEKIEQTKINPLHFFKRLEGKSEFRLRIGKFRVLAEIDIKNKVIFVLDIGNRENIYN